MPATSQPPAWLAMVRAAETVLPPTVLYPLIWPAAAARTAWEWAGMRRTVEALPASFQTAGSTLTWWIRRIPLNALKVTVLWPDRAAAGRWRSRWQLADAERFAAARATGRPVILASLHYGPTTSILPLLRRDGIPAAALTALGPDARPPVRRWLHGAADRAYGLEQVPYVIGVPAMEEAIAFLRAGPGVLVMLADGPRGRQVTSRLGDHDLQISSGVLQVAAMSGAVVLPCLVTAGPGLRLTVRFAEPVPDECVTDYRQHPSACAYLHRAWAPWLQAHPEQCYSPLVAAVRPAVSGPRS